MIARHFHISDGNHLEMSRHFTPERDAVPYYRGQDLNGFFLEDARPVKMQRAVLRTGAALLIAATLWAGLTPIREMAIAPGLIVPRGEIRSIQHLEGGIVAEIYHYGGDTVKVGDPLIRLAGDQTGGDLVRFRLPDTCGVKQSDNEFCEFFRRILDFFRRHGHSVVDVKIGILGKLRRMRCFPKQIAPISYPFD